MLAGTALLIVIAVHLMNRLQGRETWWGWVGGVLAVGGVVILAAASSSSRLGWCART